MPRNSSCADKQTTMASRGALAPGGNVQPLLLLGASVRAAAWSALRGGLVQPWCIDLFADADLQRACTARTIPPTDYPHDFLAAARQAPPGPWLYTGALENYPDLIAAIT